MNLYFLVEGRRTEAIVYPEWLKTLLPGFERVENVSDVVDNHYILMSGFGYPNLLSHVKNAIQDIETSGKFEFFIICVDSDDLAVKAREKEILSFIDERRLWPGRAKVRVIIQKRCIESWFLGNRARPKRKRPDVLQRFLAYYDIFKKDPEEMGKPPWYNGSVGAFHVDYLSALLTANGQYYSKKNPHAVCGSEYLGELIGRAQTTGHLGTFRHFLKLCNKIKASSR